jgi:hypothetical protein
MLAAVLYAPGPPEAFKIEHVPTPDVGADDVLVKIAACGVSYRDLLERNGTYRRDVTFPLIVGFEIGGVVEQGRIERLTTQLFIAGSPYLDSDYVEGAVSPDLVIQLEPELRMPGAPPAYRARFDVALDGLPQ